MPDISEGPRATNENISKVAEVEAKFDERRTLTDRITDAIADWTGGAAIPLS